MTDPIVARVCAAFQKRSAFGLQKYGVTVEESQEGHAAFLQHLQHELMDAVIYIEKLKTFVGEG